MENNDYPINPFDKFRQDLQREIERYKQSSSPVRTDKIMLNPAARTALIVVMSRGQLPVFAMYNIMYYVFNKEPEEIMKDIWKLHKSGNGATLNLYLTSHAIALNKLRQADGMLALSQKRMTGLIKPIFLIQDHRIKD